MKNFHKFHNVLLGVSVLPALLIMPVMADISVDRQFITDDSTVTWTGDNVSNMDYLSAEGRTDDNPGFGGRVFVDRGSKLTVDSSVYDNITFDGSGGVIATRTPKYGKSAVLGVNGTVFTNNHTRADGGAIASYNELSIAGSTFTGNTAMLEQDEDGKYTVQVTDLGTPMGGGALALGAESTANIISIETTEFMNNKSGLNGGAIATRLAKDANNSAAKLDIGATFTGNEALENGGAIYNSFYANNGLGKGDGVTISGTFTENKAGVKGGAIYNDGSVDKAGNPGGVMTVLNSSFTDNQAVKDGGAIYNSGTLTLKDVEFMDNSGRYGGAIENYGADTIASIIMNNMLFDRNTASEDGGAVDNDTAMMTIANSEFTGNEADGWGGAISNGGTLVVTNTVFDDNHAENASAIQDYLNSVGGVQLTDSIVKNNVSTEVGALGLYTRNATSVIENTTFTNNETTYNGVYDRDNMGGAAISIGAEAKVKVINSVFNGNHTDLLEGGAIGTRKVAGHDNSDAKLDIINSVFTGNWSNVNGGALENNFYNSDTNAGSVTVKDSLFASNEAASGGAVFNGGADSLNNLANIKFIDTTFTGNIASEQGGAIYNEGIVSVVAQDKDVFFTGNTANGSANDIYNAGSLALDAAAGRLISLAGGVDGASGTLDIVGNGTVDIANALKNQTVTHSAGELHLRGVDLTGSAVAVGKNATINTIDNAVNDYSSFITLADGASVRADATDIAADKFALATDNTVNLTSLNLLSDFTGAKTNQLTSSGKIAVADTVKTYTSTGKYAITGSSDNSGNITVTNAGTGGLFAAADDTTTGTRETVTYSVTGNDATVANSAEIKNADLIVKGNGATNQVSLDANLTVGDTSSLTIEDASFAGAGTIENKSGGVLTILDSTIATNINNSGTLFSDPTTYSAVVTNSGTASFDGDTFNTSATLNNTGIVNLLNGVIFNTGAKITGNGVTNLVNGETVFNNTVSSNTVKLAKGADFSGTLTGTGTLDTRNDTIDDISGSVAGGNLYVDAKLRGTTGAIDSLASSTGATIKEINITDSEYGTNGSYALTVGDASLANDLRISGDMNYFTKVSKNGSDVVFSDKLMNTSGMHAQLGDWGDGNYIAASSAYDATTDAYTAQGQTVGAALTALDNAVADKVDTADIYTAVVDDTPVAGGDAKVLSVNAFQSSIQNLMDNVGINWTQEQGFEGGLTIGDDFGVTAAGVATLGATTVSSLTVGGRTTSGIDNVVTADSTNLITSGAVNTAITNALANGGNAYQTSENVAGAISANAQNALYNSATYTSGTIGAAIKSNATQIADINAVLGTIDGLIAGADATTTSDNETPYHGNLAVGTTVENHLLALDAAIGDMRGFAATDNTGNTYATNTTSVASNLVALDGAAQSNAQAISDLEAVVGHASSGTDVATGLFANVEENASAIATLNGDETVANSVANKIATALANSGFETTTNVNAAIISKGQNATYNANTVQDGTVGKAIANNASAIADINTSDVMQSGIDSAKVAQIATNKTNIENNASAIEDINTSDVMQSGIDSAKVAQIATNKTNIENNASAIEDINASDVMQSGIDSTKVAQIAINANDIVAERNRATNAEADLRGDFVSADALTLTNAKNFAAERDALTLGAANAYTDKQVEKLDKNLSAGIAGAVALSSVAVSDVRRGEMSIGAGYGYFNGQSAGAFGAAMGLTNRWSVNAGAGVSGYDVSFRAGTNYKFKLF